MYYNNNFIIESISYKNEEGIDCIEQWLDIPEYEGLYQISDLGRVKSLEKPRKKSANNPNSFIRLKILKPSLSGKYLCTALYKEGVSKSFLIHHLVSISFFNFKPHIGNIIVDHKNNIQTDNRLINLQLITRRENNTKDRKNKIGLLGVYEIRGGFTATIGLNGKNYALGTFKTKEEANEKYTEAFNLLQNNKDIYHLIKTKKNKTLFRGVYSSGEKFVSQIYYKGNTYNLGSFESKEKASEAYELAYRLKKEKKPIKHLFRIKKDRK